MNIFFLIISGLFGLLPFNRKNHRNSDVLVDYALMVVVPISYLTCYGLAVFGQFSIAKLPSCDSISNLGSTLFMHVGCFVYVTIYLLTLRRRKGFYLKFEQRLAEIDGLIMKCEEVVGEKIVLQEKDYLTYFAWLLVVSIFGYDIFYDVREMVDLFKEYAFIPNMINTFPFVAGSIVQGQFIYFVSIVSNRFKKLNGLFERINLECDKKRAPLTVFDIENYNNQDFVKKRNVPSITKSFKNDDVDDLVDDFEGEQNVVTRVPDGRTSESNLPNLFKLHDKILSLSVLINSEFGPQCVPYMTACFVISIFGIFLETKVIFIVGGKSRILDYVVFMYVIWSFTMLYVGYLVLRLCCNALGQSKQSAMIVHEIMQKRPAFMLNNDLYYNKMKSFTLQFLHWENYFQFDGIGLFALDYTFIFSTVSAATSYLIVLLQFDMSTILRNENLL